MADKRARPASYLRSRIIAVRQEVARHALSRLETFSDGVYAVAAFGSVRRATWSMMLLTLAHLSSICLVPWAAAMLAAFPTARQVVITSAFVGWCGGATLVLLVRHMDVTFPMLPPRVSRLEVIVTFVSLVAVASGFVTVYLCYAMFVLHPILYLTPRRLLARIFGFAVRPTEAV